MHTQLESKYIAKTKLVITSMKGQSTVDEATGGNQFICQRACLNI